MDATHSAAALRASAELAEKVMMGSGFTSPLAAYSPGEEKKVPCASKYLSEPFTSANAATGILSEIAIPTLPFHQLREILLSAIHPTSSAILPIARTSTRASGIPISRATPLLCKALSSTAACEVPEYAMLFTEIKLDQPKP